MRRAASVLLLAAACAAVCAAACRRTASTGRPADAGVPDAAPSVQRPEVVVVDRVSFDPSLWPPEAGDPPDATALVERISLDLAASRLFLTPDDKIGEGVRVRRVRVRAAYVIEVAPRQGKRPGQLRAGATFRLSWLNDAEAPDLSESALCDGPLPGDGAPLATGARQLLDCALSAALGGITEKEAVRRGDETALLAALDSDDPSLRSVAFAAIGERRVSAAVPKLLALLSSEDVYVRDGAIGALVALREERAIKPLTEGAEFKDLDQMRRVIDAVGAIGGEEARAYLEFVATGHDVPAVRELAKQALARLERRAPPAPRE